MKRILKRVGAVFVIVAALLLFWWLYCMEVRERQRLEANQHALLTDITFYRTRDSLSAAGVERLTLSNREFREYATELEKTVEALNLKVHRL